MPSTGHSRRNEFPRHRLGFWLRGATSPSRPRSCRRRLQFRHGWTPHWRPPQTGRFARRCRANPLLRRAATNPRHRRVFPEAHRFFRHRLKNPPSPGSPRASLLPWSAYVRLLAVKNENARVFYETEALRAGWSVRQLDRQIQSQFYERTALSRNKAAMLRKGARPRPEDTVAPEEDVKDPYVLEFLGLEDEYSETDLEAALIRHLESFLLELGGDFCFAGRQRRLRIGDAWYRVDLVFYHRRLRCLVLIDLKLGRFTHADAGQMHTYLNYAAAHWTRPDENPPVGLILCAQKDEALARYALGNLPNKVLAAEYRTVLPDEKLIAADLQKTRRMLEQRGLTEGGKR